MRPTKVRSLSTHLQRSRRRARQAKKIRAQEDLHRFAHEIANQLTIINLSCFKLRGALAKGLPASPLGDLERVERAVLEMTNLVQTLGRPEDDPTTNPQAPASQTTNVYRLFDAQDR
jgi:hypothetical protein